MKILILFNLCLFLQWFTFSLSGQSFETFYMERISGFLQVGPDMVEAFPPEHPHIFSVGVNSVRGSFDFVEISKEGGEIFNFEQLPDNFLGFGHWFGSLRELNSIFPAGTYDVYGRGQEIGDFHFEVVLPAMNIPPPVTVSNWWELQNIDPGEALTILFEPWAEFSDSVLLYAEVKYYSFYNERMTRIWHTPNTRTGGMPGLALDTRSITIPENTLINEEANPDFFIFITAQSHTSELLAPAPLGFARILTMDTMTLIVQIQTKKQDIWAGYVWENDRGDINTMDFIGWLNVGNTPWVWSYSLGRYIYIPEENISSMGGWFYLYK